MLQDILYMTVLLSPKTPRQPAIHPSIHYCTRLDHDGDRILLPALAHHADLDGFPDGFDNLAVAPSTRAWLRRNPLVDLGAHDAATPGLDGTGQRVATPANVDAGTVLEQFLWLLPLVTLELPGLAGGEHGHHA